MIYIGKHPQTTKSIVIKFFESITPEVINKMSPNERAYLFHVCIDILKSTNSTRLFNLEEPSQSQQYTDLISYLFNSFPSQRASLIVMQCEIQIKYHLFQLKKGIFPDLNSISEVYTTLAMIFNEVFDISEEAMQNNTLFYSLVDAKIKDEQPFSVNSLATNTSSTFVAPYYFSFPTASEIGAKIVSLLELYDLTLRKNAITDMWLPQFQHQILSSHERIAVMFNKFYSRIGISREKAHVSYVLGSFWMKQEDEDLARLAECVLFESVYLFQKCPPLCSQIPTIMTADALKAMKKFGEILHINRKYEYTAIMYEIYIQNNRLLTSDFDFKFIDELAAMAVKNDDWSRSIEYYTILNEKAIREKRVAVIANISSKLSALYMEKGELRNAERVKRDALEMIKLLSSSSEFKLDLEIDYAKLLLNGGNLERCISICFNLVQHSISCKNPELYITLADAYLKKRWYKECEKVLKEFALIIECNFMQLQQQQEMRLLEIVTKYYLRRCMFGNAIESVNIALYRCNRTFSTLAQLFKLKGKILMEVSKWSNPITFPNDLAPSEKDRLPILTQIQKSEILREFLNEQFLYSKRPMYETAKDCIVDAVVCFQKAKKYYEACSNEINLARMDLLIAQTMIEHIFIPVAVLSKKPEDFSFITSSSNISGITSIDLEMIYAQYIEPTLDVAVSASDVFMSIDANLTAAECRLLQGRFQSAKQFWCEMRDIFFTLFVDNNSHVVVANGAPPSVIERISNLMKRCARLLLLFESSFISSNIGIFDTLYIITLEYDQIVKRTQEPTALSVDQIDTKATKISSFVDSESIDKNKLCEGLYRLNTPMSNSMSLPKAFSFSAMLRSPTSPFKSVIDNEVNNYKAGDLKEDSQRAQLKYRVIERVFYCLLSMKFDRRKYPGEIDGQLRFKNQQSMRRLYNLMNAIRESKLSTHKKKSFFQRSKLSNDTKTINKAIELLDSKNMTLLPGDKLLVDSLMSTFNESKGNSVTGTLKTTMNLQMEGNLQKQVSLTPCLASLKNALKNSKKNKTFEKLVLLIHFDNVIGFYVPNTAQKSFVLFGGRSFPRYDYEIESEISVKDSESVLSLSKLIGSISHNIVSKSNMDLTKLQVETEYQSLHEYIKELILESMRDKKDKIMDKNNVYMLRNCFSNVSDVFKFKPDPESYAQNLDFLKKNGFNNFNYNSYLNQKNGTFTKKKSMGSIPRPEMLPNPSTPISLIVPSSLQVIPWELLFEENALRYFSIHNLGTRHKKRLTEVGKFIPKTKKYPRFFCFFSSDDQKFILPVEEERKQWILQQVNSERLHFKPTCESRENEDIKTNLPFHVPIVKYGKKPSSKSYRKKYEHVEFFKLTRLLTDTPRFIRNLEMSLQPEEYPVFLFSWVDLQDLSPFQVYIAQHYPGALMVFVPDGCYRKFVEFLMIMYECYWGTSASPSTIPTPRDDKEEELKLNKFILACSSVLRSEKEYVMPFALFP